MDPRFAKAASDPRFSKNYARQAESTDVRFGAAPSKKRRRPAAPAAPAAAAAVPAAGRAAAAAADPRFARGAAWGKDEAEAEDAPEALAALVAVAEGDAGGVVVGVGDPVEKPELVKALEAEAEPVCEPLASALADGVPVGNGAPEGLADDDGLVEGRAVVN